MLTMKMVLLGFESLRGGLFLAKASLSHDRNATDRALLHGDGNRDFTGFDVVWC